VTDHVEGCGEIEAYKQCDFLAVSLSFYIGARASTSIPTLSQIVCQIERSFIALEMSLVDDRPVLHEIDLM